MKRFLFTIFLLGVLSPLAAQLYHPGEQLFYRVSYKACLLYTSDAADE